MKSNMLAGIKSTMKKVEFKLKKHSPEILIVAGVVGVVASTIVACKATTKIDAILYKAKNDIETIHECTDNEAFKEEYTKEDAQKHLVIVYAKTGVELVKLYTPAVVLGTVSIGCILASNNILRQRNVALAAAYLAVDKGFKEYRGRVVERFGEEIDRELRYDIKAEKIKVKEIDAETGEEKEVEIDRKVVGANGHSVYARFFDEYSKNWQKDAEYNLMFLKAQQAHANNILQVNGHIFLNEVYDLLDIPRTKAGQIVGWVYKPENPIGDNYVDFGIFNYYKEDSRAFVNGYERSILLDFNVDGNIWDLI